MTKVKNSRCITQLSMGSLKANRTRNIILIIAIALTTLLITSLFTIGGSMVKSLETSTMYQVGTSAHAGFKFLDRQQYEKVYADTEVKDISYNIIVGFAENEELKDEYTEIRYTEEKSAEWSFSAPQVGRLPVEKNEIAVPTSVLDALGVPYELGANVPLEFSIGDKQYSEEFVLCGYWEKASETLANEAYVSREYQQSIAPEWKDSADNRIAAGEDIYAGSINPSLWFDSASDIDGQMQSLKERCGFGDDVNDGVNWAYAGSSLDFAAVMLVVLILLLVVVSGYLIIYNIFYISISGDIRFYGLLKTIGTTGRQLRKIVYRQALLLSAVGIPIGLVLGYVMSMVILPWITKSMTDISCRIYAEPGFFIISAVFALFTVFISCIRPCRLLKKLSPMEAVRYQHEQSSNERRRRKRRERTGQRKSEESVQAQDAYNCSEKAGEPCHMRFADGSSGKRRKYRSHRNSNGRLRNTRKTVAVVLSLSLSIIMLNSTVAIVRGFDMDKYIANYATTDFIVTDSTVASVTSLEVDIKGVSQEDIAALGNTPGIKESGNVYMDESMQELSGEHLQNAKSILKERKDDFAYEGEYEMLKEDVFDWNMLSSHIYGISEFIYDFMEIVKGDFDAEKFNTGKYVIVTGYDTSGEYLYYDIGDTIRVDFADGSSKDYEVMAIGDITYALSVQHGHGMDMCITLPESEYLNHCKGGDAAMLTAFNVDDRSFDEAQEYVDNYCDAGDSNLVVKLKQDYEDSFREMELMYFLVGGALSFILGVIGVLNFTNVTITSINARRNVLAVMQAVGMTDRQLKRMLIRESLQKILLTFAFVITIGTALSFVIVKLITMEMWMFTYRFTIWPIFASLPVFMLIAVIVPEILHRRIKKESLVERLREE